MMSKKEKLTDLSPLIVKHYFGQIYKRWFLRAVAGLRKEGCRIYLTICMV